MVSEVGSEPTPPFGDQKEEQNRWTQKTLSYQQTLHKLTFQFHRLLHLQKDIPSETDVSRVT